MQGKKHNKKSLLTEEITSGQRFWEWASRRREGNDLGYEERKSMNIAEIGVGGWTVVIPDTGTIMGQVDWRWAWRCSLRAGLCSFPCSLFHLRALALYKISNRHTVHASWKFNTNETKFRALLGEHSMVWFVKTTGWDQGENESSWHLEQLKWRYTEMTG